MFTLVSEAQELASGLYCDVLKDENDNILFALDLNFPAKRGGTIRKIACIYMYENNIPFVLQNITNETEIRGKSYRYFETYKDYCKWFSYNVKA